MQYIYHQYRRLLSWIISKKSSLQQKIYYKNSITSQFRQFTSQYCVKMQVIIQKLTIYAGETNLQNSLKEVVQLMKLKQIQNIREWRLINKICESISLKNINRFQEIFEALNKKIQYYSKLCTRIQQINRITNSHQIIKKGPYLKNDSRTTQKFKDTAKKINKLSSQYDRLDTQLTPKKTIREAGKIKQNSKDIYSPYKSVRYSDGQNSNNYNALNYRNQTQPCENYRKCSQKQRSHTPNTIYKYYRDYNQKDIAYRQKLQLQMNNNLGINLQRPSKQDKKIKIKHKRYQYLNQDGQIADQYVNKSIKTPYICSQNTNAKKQPFDREKPNYETESSQIFGKIPPLFPQESLQSMGYNDSLGKQLEKQIPTLQQLKNKQKVPHQKFNQNEQLQNNSLENILAMSLLQSKRWDKNFFDSFDEKIEENDPNYCADSIDELRYTAYFNLEDSENSKNQFLDSFSDKIVLKNDQKSNDSLDGVNDSLEENSPEKLAISFGK